MNICVVYANGMSSPDTSATERRILATGTGYKYSWAKWTLETLLRDWGRQTNIVLHFKWCNCKSIHLLNTYISLRLYV